MTPAARAAGGESACGVVSLRVYLGDTALFQLQGSLLRYAGRVHCWQQDVLALFPLLLVSNLSGRIIHDVLGTWNAG